MFDDQPALLEKYEYLLNKIDVLVNKQMMFVQTRLAAEKWSEIVNFYYSYT